MNSVKDDEFICLEMYPVINNPFLSKRLALRKSKDTINDKAILIMTMISEG